MTCHLSSRCAVTVLRLRMGLRRSEVMQNVTNLSSGMPVQQLHLDFQGSPPFMWLFPVQTDIRTNANTMGFWPFKPNTNGLSSVVFNPIQLFQPSSFNIQSVVIVNWHPNLQLGANLKRNWHNQRIFFREKITSGSLNFGAPALSSGTPRGAFGPTLGSGTLAVTGRAFFTIALATAGASEAEAGEPTFDWASARDSTSGAGLSGQELQVDHLWTVEPSEQQQVDQLQTAEPSEQRTGLTRY